MQKSVLHLIPSFHQGGSEQQAVQLVKLLKDDETYRVHVACLDKNGVLLSDIKDAGFAEIPEFPLSSFYDVNMLRQLRKCSKLIRDNNIDVVQTHDYYTNIFGMTAAALARVPVRIAAKRETGMRSGAQKFVELRAFGFANAIVANAERVKAYLADAGVPERKIPVVYNGIDVGRFRVPVDCRTALCESFGLPTDPVTQFVTIVANLRSAVKDHKMFLRSAARVKGRMQNAAFVIAGEGELVDELKAFAAELGLAERTFFLGRCSRVPELLAISSVCVLASESEGFANSILEYMAAGKPVVATAVGGAAEAVEEGVSGNLVASGNDEAMADWIADLLNSPAKAEEMGSNGRRIAERKFSLEARKQKMLDLYETELRRSGRGGGE